MRILAIMGDDKPLTIVAIRNAMNEYIARERKLSAKYTPSKVFEMVAAYFNGDDTICVNGIFKTWKVKSREKIISAVIQELINMPQDYYYSIQKTSMPSPCAELEPMIIAGLEARFEEVFHKDTAKYDCIYDDKNGYSVEGTLAQIIHTANIIVSIWAFHGSPTWWDSKWSFALKMKK